MNNKNPKNKEDFWMFKAPMELKIELDKVRLERIKKGKDINERVPYKRLGLAMSRHPQLLIDLINTDLLKDTKI